MSAKVIELPVVTKLSLDPNRILAKAQDQLSVAVVVGYRNDGSLYFASSEPSGPEVVWLLEKAKAELFKIVE